ncbi:MAG: hypothetical protein WC901_02950 [Candidatus Margulisiibacteriota bacterium]
METKTPKKPKPPVEINLAIEAEDRSLPPIDSLELAQYYVNKYKHKLPEINKKLITTSKLIS